MKKSFLMICGFFIILFLLLSHWQWDRYQYKKNIMSLYQNRLLQPPISFSNVANAANNQFQRVKVEGQYKNELTLLIQNQFNQDQVGYEVFTPFKIKDEKNLLLIDRGWIPRNAIPAFKPIPQFQSITGYIKYPNEYQFILGKNILNPNEFPLVMQKLDVNELATITHQTFFPYSVRLDESAPNGFKREWIITTVLPEHHLGYMIQWLVLACVVAVGAFFYLKKEIDLSRTRKPEFKIILLLLIFILPFITAEWLFYHPHFIHFKTMNHGQLINPPIVIPLKEESHRWKIIYIPKGCCATQCENNLFLLHQLRKALGKNASRLDLIVALDMSCSKVDTHDIKRMDLHFFTPLIKQFKDKTIYLMDPLGNVFMVYPETVNYMDILKDLKHTMEISQIG